jgi:hypothetical protein
MWKFSNRQKTLRNTDNHKPRQQPHNYSPIRLRNLPTYAGSPPPLKPHPTPQQLNPIIAAKNAAIVLECGE